MSVDDDILIQYQKVNENIGLEIFEETEKIMCNAPWLWRIAKEEHINFSKIKNIQKNECTIYEKSIVTLSAYEKRISEETLSLFELNEHLRVSDEKYLDVEATTLLSNIAAETLNLKPSSIPLALIRKKLYKTLQMEPDNIKVFRGITKSPSENQNNYSTYHWDIYLPYTDAEKQRLYQILAMSSYVCENKVSKNLNRAAEALKEKRTKAITST